MDKKIRIELWKAIWKVLPAHKYHDILITTSIKTPTIAQIFPREGQEKNTEHIACIK